MHACNSSNDAHPAGLEDGASADSCPSSSSATRIGVAVRVSHDSASFPLSDGDVPPAQQAPPQVSLDGYLSALQPSKRSVESRRIEQGSASAAVVQGGPQQIFRLFTDCVWVVPGGAHPLVRTRPRL